MVEVFNRRYEFSCKPTSGGSYTLKYRSKRLPIASFIPKSQRTSDDRLFQPHMQTCTGR